MSESAAEWVSLDRLHEWAKNPRLNDGEPVEQVAASIRRLGWGAPIVARMDGEIIAGHTRFKAAKLLGLDRVPVRFVDLDPADAALMALADNRLNESAKWDMPALQQIMSEFSFDDVEIAGWDKGDLDQMASELLGGDPQQGSDPGQDAADVQVTHRTSLGDEWALGRHRLCVGDSREALDWAAEISPRLWIMDPPFNIAYGQFQRLETIDVAVVWHRSKDALAWMGSEFAGEEWGLHTLVFTGGIRGQHNHTLPCCMHENVAVLRRKWWDAKEDALDAEVIDASGCQKTSDHRHRSWQENSGGVVAAQSIGMSWAKPTMQMSLAMAYVPEGSGVWDPCAGSGSSLIAAELHNRTWRGCETNPEHADLILARWEKTTGQTAERIGNL